MHLDHQQYVLHSTGIQRNLRQILAENYALLEGLDYEGFGALIKGVQQAESIFLLAAGRSGFAMRSVAMRLMHLGFKVYFVGDTTTPAIKSTDLLWVASGSGTTGSIVRAAEKAKSVGANVIAFTTNPASTLAGSSDMHILLPAAEKEDHAGSKSKQYAGSLFEQALLLIGDAIFMELWKMDGAPAETLWKRHANME